MLSPSHPLYIDVDALDTGLPEWPVRRSLEVLLAMYERLDAALARTTANLALPCYDARGGRSHCADCCHESVFLTGLEWLAVVDFAQRHLPSTRWETVIEEMLKLYQQHAPLIDRISSASEGERATLVKGLRFSCPLLDAQGCSVYPAREMLGRLFGQAANAEGGLYGCGLSGAFFGSREAGLVSAEGWSRQLRALPLTHARQVYPYWFHVTYATLRQS